MKGLIITLIIIVILVGGGVATYFVLTAEKEPQKIKINSIEITNVYRDCTINPGGNYRDTTIQTTINVDATNKDEFVLPLLARDCLLKVGPNNVDGFALNKIPTPQPYKEGIFDSGLHMATGGELDGDKSDVLTFCCGEICDVANLEIC